MYIVYVLRSLKDGLLYTGVTNDLRRRLREHDGGKTRSLRGRRPLALVYTEEYSSKQEAIARERFFKTPAGGIVKQELVKAAEQRAGSTEGWPSG